MLDAFGPIEEALQNTFLPALLNMDVATIKQLRLLLSLPMKQGWIRVLDLTTT